MIGFVIIDFRFWEEIQRNFFLFNSSFPVFQVSSFYVLLSFSFIVRENLVFKTYYGHLPDC